MEFSFRWTFVVPAVAAVEVDAPAVAGRRSRACRRFSRRSFNDRRSSSVRCLAVIPLAVDRKL